MPVSVWNFMKKIILLDDYNQKIHIGGGCIGTVIPSFGDCALRAGWKIIEVYEESGRADGLRLEGQGREGRD